MGSGLCALSVNDRQCYLAVPFHAERGEVLVYDALNLQVPAWLADGRHGKHEWNWKKQSMREIVERAERRREREREREIKI